jgi:phenylpropionate dioxygenase-like ring-hydroxylating dioxygenase large terminal subunit
MLEASGRLRESWYAALLSRDLRPGRPAACTLFEVPLVLWRDAEGRPVAMEDRCAHRHAPLSRGDLFDGKIGCPYHGWTYDRDGLCVDAPSQGPGARAPGCRIPAYPCRERDGLVWVHMGADAGEGSSLGEPFPMPHIDEPGWNHYYMVTPFANGVTHLVENFMDVPHTRFVHSGWFRKAAGKRIEVDVERTPDSVLVTYHMPDDEIGFSGRILNPRREPTTHTDRFYMPNTTRVDYGFGSRRGFVITSTCSPRGPYDTLVFTLISYRLGWLNRFARLWLPWYTRQVIGQDVDIMRIQGDNLRRFDGGNPAGPEGQAGGRPFQGTAADLQHAFIESLREHARRRGSPEEAPAPRRERISFWV